MCCQFYKPQIDNAIRFCGTCQPLFILFKCENKYKKNKFASFHLRGTKFPKVDGEQKLSCFDSLCEWTFPCTILFLFLFFGFEFFRKLQYTIEYYFIGNFEG